MATLKKRMQRGNDKVVGQGFYTARWGAHGRNAEHFRIVFYGSEGIGPGYVAEFSREEVEKIVSQFQRYLDGNNVTDSEES